MRPIEFRAKRIDNGEWVYGHGITQKPVVQIICEKVGTLDFHYEVDPATVGQFTGLHDKNGNKIWEGDYDTEGNMIDWCDQCAGYQFKQIDIRTSDIIECHNCAGNFMLQDYISDFSIIGNIHDKPTTMSIIEQIKNGAKQSIQ